MPKKKSPAKKRTNPAKKKVVHKIKTAIVVDFMGHGFGDVTPEMEIKEHKERFTEFATPAKLDVYTPSSTYPGDLKPGTDLLIYDFGGVGPGCEGLMTGNARHLVRWAADNPSSLVVIVSTFSYDRYVKYEAEDMGLLDLHNIVVDCSMGDEKDPWYRNERYSPFPEWFEQAHGITSKEYK